METSNPPAVQQRPWIYWVISDTWELFKRNLVQLRQVPDQLLGVTLQPVIFIVLFRYVFGGAIHTGGLNYADYLIPGIIVMGATLTSLTSMVSITKDMNDGIIDRFRSLPMIKFTILAGTISSDLVRSILGLATGILVGLAVGFRPQANVGDWLISIGLLLLITYTFSWLAAPFGMMVKSVEAAQQIGFVFFPLTFASGAFVPTQSMPTWLRGFAANQPLSQVIDAVRALLLKEPLGNHLWLSLIWCFGIIAISIPLASWMFKRKTSE